MHLFVKDSQVILTAMKTSEGMKGATKTPWTYGEFALLHWFMQMLLFPAFSVVNYCSLFCGRKVTNVCNSNAVQLDYFHIPVQYTLVVCVVLTYFEHVVYCNCSSYWYSLFKYPTLKTQRNESRFPFFPFFLYHSDLSKATIILLSSSSLVLFLLSNTIHQSFPSRHLRLAFVDIAFVHDALNPRNPPVSCPRLSVIANNLFRHLPKKHPPTFPENHSSIKCKYQ